MKYFIKEWLVPALIALVIVLFLNTFIFQLVTVPSGSMIPTIMEGDRLYINKIFKVDNVQRGDILVFKSDELDKLLVKRLIGLPGEQIDIMSNGDIYINGNKLEESYAVPTTCREQSFKVPADCFFFLGDNRPNSKDSRYWDEPYISKEKVIGRAIFTFFPFSRIGKFDKIQY